MMPSFVTQSAPQGRCRSALKKAIPVSTRHWLRAVASDARDRVLVDVGRLPSRAVRNFFYRRAGVKIPRTSAIYWRAEFYSPERVRIGEYTTVGDSAFLDARRGIEIGDCVDIGSRVVIWTLQHDIDDPDFAAVGGPVVIEDYAWVSSGATILPNVRIGEGAVVAAGAVVTKDVPPYTVVGGIPARFIRHRARGLRYRVGATGAKRFV